MAQLIPPSPVGVPMGSSTWNQWLETVRQIINSGAAGVLWTNINFAGSNITDLASRAHNNLQSMQGGAAGEYYHLTAAEYAGLDGSTGNRWKGGVDTSDDLVINDASAGLVLKDSAGHYWRVQVTTAGALTTTDLGTTKP